MVPARVEGAEADEKSWYRPSSDKSPRLQTETTSYGFHYAAIRKPIKNPDTHQYIRVTEYVAPYYSLIPPNNNYRVAAVIVPINDEETAFHFIAWGGPNVPTTEFWRQFTHAVPGVDVDDKWRVLRTIENDFKQDRQRMKDGHFTGIDGIPNEDIAMWVSMGARVQRHTDILGASDLAIVEFRRLMADAARKVAEGGAAIGADLKVPQVRINSHQGVYPKDVDWRTLIAEQQAGQAAE